MIKHNLFKRAVTGFVAMSLMLSVGSNVLAAEETIRGENGSKDLDVQAMIIGSDAVVYRTDISWGDMAFTFSSAGESWDPDTHKKTGSSGWVTTRYGESNKITVTNHSNASVKVDYAFDYDGYTGFGDAVEGNFYKDKNTSIQAAEITDLTSESNPELETINTNTLKSAVGTVFSNAPSADVYFSFSGNPEGVELDTLTTVGKIQLTIAPTA